MLFKSYNQTQYSTVTGGGGAMNNGVAIIKFIWCVYYTDLFRLEGPDIIQSHHARILNILSSPLLCGC